MSKWAEVNVTISKCYAVEIEDNESIEDAKEYIYEQVMGDDVEFGDCTVAKNESESNTIYRCADERLSL